MTGETHIAEPGDTVLVAEAEGAALTPAEADLERTIVIEEEATKRELARLETELKIAKLQSEKPPWLEEMVLRLEAPILALSSLLTQPPSTQPAPQAVAIAAPQETEATAPGAIAETTEQTLEADDSEVTQENPEPAAAPEENRRRTFSRGI